MKTPTLRHLLNLVVLAGAAQVIPAAHAQPAPSPGARPFFPSWYQSDRTVGPQADGSIVVSNNQTITPAGQVIVFGGNVRAKAVALNPKNTTAALLAEGAPEAVIIFDRVTGAIVQNFKSPSSTGSYNGITYSADGTKLFFSQDNNHVNVTSVDPATGELTLTSTVNLPALPANPPYPYYDPSSNIPGAIALSPDGAKAYVVLNAANALGVIDVASGTLTTEIPVGNVPNSIAISADGHYAYVSNEGGRAAKAGEYTYPSNGAAIVADPTNAFAITGTVSVVDLTTSTVAATIDVGLHPAGLTLSGDHLYVANSFSDTISVVDVRSNRVVRTIDAGVPVPGRPFGAGPNAITVVDGRTAYVTLGTSNAIAVLDVANPFANRAIGYIPAAYFPTSIAYDAVNKQLVVANDKGVGTHEIAPGYSGYVTGYDFGVAQLIPVPDALQLAKYTEEVIHDNHWSAQNPNLLVGPEYVNPRARPVPIPLHIGEPSVIKHVFLVIKENQTYDYNLGDLAQGNGDASLAVFAPGAPNLHALVSRFPLLDNAYAPSRQSADGHVWIDESGSFYSNEILSPDWLRSYPGGTIDDALTTTPRGFLWSAAQNKGLSVRLYGESATTVVRSDPNPATGAAYTWGDYYNTAMCIEGQIPADTCATLAQVPFTALVLASGAASGQAIFDPYYPSFTLTIPDQYRLDYYLSTFEQQLETDTVPNLTILWLPDDHTEYGAAGYPGILNEIADNDLALGRLVETVSHSKVWGSSAIFVEEDDSANDQDHVDGHRMTSFVFSPWTAPRQAEGQGKVVHTTYTQENINRTIENILGFEPLTQFDLVASPMFDAFG
ncbi:MAG: beta-propeller fold lactonase family protein, partial [Polyangiaceae bacterium]|nr:beta-propeller fold lactonase family protein [Polyangiaceae bacterium]